MEAAPLKVRNDGRQRVNCAANADVQQDDCAVELRIAFAGDAIDQKLGSLDWFDSVLAVERPVDQCSRSQSERQIRSRYPKENSASTANTA